MVFRVGFLYFLITFVVAFLLGVVRVTFIIPLVGELCAVLIEVPLMIFISWKVSAKLMLRYFSDRADKEYIAVGSIAFLFLMVAEYFLAIFAFGLTSGEYFLRMKTDAGIAGLFGQVGFAFVPWVQRKKRVDV